jgi:hypothetical protein
VATSISLERNKWTNCDEEQLPAGWCMIHNQEGTRSFKPESVTKVQFWGDARRRTGWTCDTGNRCTMWDKLALPDTLSEHHQQFSFRT